MYFKKASSRKLSDMSKISFDIHNFQTKIMSFPDQEKLLKEVVFSLAVSMNDKSNNSQIKHCPCPE